jgi:hypothetical protein
LEVVVQKGMEGVVQMIDKKLEASGQELLTSRIDPYRSFRGKSGGQSFAKARFS